MTQPRHATNSELRTLGPGSSQLLADLSIDTFMQAYRHVHSRENIRRYCERHYSKEAAKKALQKDDTSAVVAFVDTEAAGFYVMRHWPCPLAPDVAASELKQIYVLSAHYRSGLGMQLFEHAADAARRHGSEYLWLCVSDANLRARAFYRKLGFAAAGAGPVLEVGTDRLPSTILQLDIGGDADGSVPS